MTMNIYNLTKHVLCDRKTSIRWCIDKGLIPGTKNCPKCRVVNEKKKYFSKLKIKFRKKDFFSQLLENFSIFEKYCEKKILFENDFSFSR